MIVSGTAPPMVDGLRRVRRCMFRRVFCRFCHARSRVPIVFGPFHYCAFCERAAPDAPETIDDQRRCTGCRYRTIYGGSRGSASLPTPASVLTSHQPLATSHYLAFRRFISRAKACLASSTKLRRPSALTQFPPNAIAVCCSIRSDVATVIE